MIAVNQLDKLVISWNDFAAGSLTYTGTTTWVLQSSDLLAGNAIVNAASFLSDASVFRIVPALSQAPSSTVWAVYNGVDYLGVLAYTGTPLRHNVVATETELARPSLPSVPPQAEEPGGTGVIDTGDARILSAVWAPGGVLWMSGNDGCVPVGETTTRSCLRVTTVSTTTPNPTLGYDEDMALAGAYLYDPAVAVDAFGNAFFSYTESSATLPVSAMVVDQLAGASFGTFGIPSEIWRGGSYVGTR